MKSFFSFDGKVLIVDQTSQQLWFVKAIAGEVVSNPIGGLYMVDVEDFWTDVLERGSFNPPVRVSIGKDGFALKIDNFEVK